MINSITNSIKRGLEELQVLNQACDVLATTVQEVEKAFQAIGIEFEVKTPDTSYEVLAFKKLVVSTATVRRLHVRWRDAHGQLYFKCWTDLSREDKIYTARYLPELIKYILQEAKRLTKVALETQQSILKETSTQ